MNPFSHAFLRFQKIGLIDDTLTEFNVGEGNTDESDSLNIIHITNTSGTSGGVTNNPTSTTGTRYYVFTILAPGCTAMGSQEVQLNTDYDQDGHWTRETTVDVKLWVQAWQHTVYDLHGNQSKFAMCLEADLVMLDSEYNEVLLERKHFDFIVGILLPSFDLDDPVMDDNGRKRFSFPCGRRRRTRRETAWTVRYGL